jgi:Pectic acid lyase
MLKRTLKSLMLSGLCCVCGWTWAAESLTKDEAAAALRKAVTFFRNDVAVNGGYLWKYTTDLTLREGEGKADDHTAWVQPPGTPSVGSAYLDVHERTGDEFYLEAARETAEALIQSQLRSGGWSYRICFEPKARARYAYRVDAGSEKGSNTSTLDDNTTQAALRFLMRVDKALAFKDASLHEAVMFGLQSMLEAQYPNGAWPQRFDGPTDPAKYPVKKASYPETWSRTWPEQDYRRYYTFNDNTIADCVGTMFDAYDIYGDDAYRAAAEKAGDFILLAQMPDPQPGWAQQYDHDMHPAWARKFEPPAVTGGESQGVMRTLMHVYRRTADAKYLEPLPRALAYYRECALPDGRLARFYELQTNKPLYFTKDYQLTYSSADMPTHYSFITGSALDAIEKKYKALQDIPPERLKRDSQEEVFEMSSSLATRARDAAVQLDDRGAWVENTGLRYHELDDKNASVIDCRTFARNIRVLSEFIAASE